MANSLEPQNQRLTLDELVNERKQVPSWDLKDIDGVSALTRTFTFSDFVDALAFTNRVGEAAEQSNHHPQITLTWGRVVVEWWSHSAGGITSNDIQMAAITDKLQK